MREYPNIKEMTREEVLDKAVNRIKTRINSKGQYPEHFYAESFISDIDIDLADGFVLRYFNNPHKPLVLLKWTPLCLVPIYFFEERESGRLVEALFKAKQRLDLNEGKVRNYLLDDL